MTDVTVAEQSDDFEDNSDWVYDLIAGRDDQEGRFVPATDEDQIDQTTDRDIVTRVYYDNLTESYFRVVWAYVFGGAAGSPPTTEVLDFIEVVPVEKTYIVYEEVVEDVAPEGVVPEEAD